MMAPYFLLRKIPPSAAAAAAAAAPNLLRRALFSALPEPLPPSPPPPTTTTTTTTSSSLQRLKSAIRAEGDPERVAELFLSASSTLPGFHSQRAVFSLAVLKLSRARRPDLVRRLLDPLLLSPLSPSSEGFLARILSLYSSASLPDAAASAFLLPSPHPRSDLSFSALLSAFLHNRRFRDLLDTFRRAPIDLGLSPGIASHNVLLRALCETGDLPAARDLLDEMSRPDNPLPAPNIVSFNTLLTAYLKTGATNDDDDDKFDGILREIARRGLEPSVVTYNCRIARFCAKGESFKAEELLDVMLAKGIRPNLGTFNALIGGFCKEGDADAAVTVFKRMKVMKRRNGSDGVAPNADTYVMLLRALIEKASFGEALGICRECLARKVAPPFEVVKGLIEGLVRESKAEEARDVAAKMRAVVKGDAKEAWNKVEGELSLEKGTEDSSQLITGKE